MEIFVIKICKHDFAQLYVTSYFHDRGKIIEFDSYKKAEHQIDTLTGIEPPYYYSIEKYFKKD